MSKKTSPQNLSVEQHYHPEANWRGYNALIVDVHQNFFAAKVKGKEVWSAVPVNTPLPAEMLNGLKLKRVSLVEACHMSARCEDKTVAMAESWSGSARSLLLACAAALKSQPTKP